MCNVIKIIIMAAIIMMTMLMRICLPEVTFKPLKASWVDTGAKSILGGSLD